MTLRGDDITDICFYTYTCQRSCLEEAIPELSQTYDDMLNRNEVARVVH